MGIDKMVGLSHQHALFKRLFDILFSIVGLLLTWWVIVIAWILSSLDTKSNGFFLQQRVGQYGHLFWVIKIKTMRADDSVRTTVTTSSDARITKLGGVLRKFKVDELPQFINVLLGNMSFVGPRPDVPGFANKLEGEDKIILNIKPGITGPATLKYRNEEEILQKYDDPEKYNRTVIFPDKVKINKDYIYNYSFWKDIQYIIRTIIK